MDVVYLEKVVFFYDLDGFGGLRSTQPTGTAFFYTHVNLYCNVQCVRIQVEWTALRGK